MKDDYFSDGIPEEYLWDTENKRYMRRSLFPGRWVPARISSWDTDKPEFQFDPDRDRTYQQVVLGAIPYSNRNTIGGNLESSSEGTVPSRPAMGPEKEIIGPYSPENPFDYSVQKSTFDSVLKGTGDARNPLTGKKMKSPLNESPASGEGKRYYPYGAGPLVPGEFRKEPSKPDDCFGFDRCVNETLDIEKGYSNRVSDLGGPTNRGISWETWQAHAKRYTGKEPTLENLKNLSAEDAKKIYRSEYWDKIDADEIKNPSLRRYIFDFHVNSSPGAAIGNLQKAINETGGNVAEDNILGKETMDALTIILIWKYYLMRIKRTEGSIFKI